jgi:hypothetical protein
MACPGGFPAPGYQSKGIHRSRYLRKGLGSSGILAKLPGGVDSTAGEEHAAILKQLYSRYTIQGNLVPDAHLAAIAIEHGLILYSSDHDFARFRELKWENPIV